jgi:hypothetical protein
MPDNVELVRTQVETGGYLGNDRVRAYLAEAEDLWDVLELDGNHYEDLGDRVVVAGTSCSTLGEAERLAGVEPAEGSAR